MKPDFAWSQIGRKYLHCFVSHYLFFCIDSASTKMLASHLLKGVSYLHKTCSGGEGSADISLYQEPSVHRESCRLWVTLFRLISKVNRVAEKLGLGFPFAYCFCFNFHLSVVCFSFGFYIYVCVYIYMKPLVYFHF